MISPVLDILVILTLTSAVISLTFFLAWKTLGKKAHSLTWSVAFMAATCLWGLSLVPHWFPAFQSFWLTISACGLAAVTLGLRGHCQRTKCEILPQNLWPWATAVFLLVLWSTVGLPNAGISAATVPGAAALSAFLSAAIILRHRVASHAAEVAAAASLIVVGLVLFAMSVSAYMHGSVDGVGMRDVYGNESLVALPAAYVGMVVFALLMVAADLSEEMKELAISDQLTGLLNRRGFGEQAAAAYAGSKRTGHPVSVVITDIDRFKQINDDFGHSAGDIALSRFADFLKTNRRANDICARIGGEEFALVLPGVTLADAIRIANDLRVQIHSTPIELDSTPITMTASFGVATISDNDTCLSDILARADSALYRSKREGRDRVELESSQMMLKLDGSLETISH